MPCLEYFSERPQDGLQTFKQKSLVLPRDFYNMLEICQITSKTSFTQDDKSSMKPREILLTFHCLIAFSAGRSAPFQQ